MPTWRAPFRSAPISGSTHGGECSSHRGAPRERRQPGRLGLPPRRAPTRAPRSRQLAHLGGLVSILALLLYLTWRVAFTMPDGGWNLVAAWTLVVFEAVPLIGLLIRIVTLWDIDSRAPRRVTEAGPDCARPCGSRRTTSRSR